MSSRYLHTTDLINSFFLYTEVHRQLKRYICLHKRHYTQTHRRNFVKDFLLYKSYLRYGHMEETDLLCILGQADFVLTCYIQIPSYDPLTWPDIEIVFHPLPERVFVHSIYRTETFLTGVVCLKCGRKTTIPSIHLFSTFVTSSFCFHLSLLLSF